MPEHTPAPTPHRAVYGFAFAVFFAVAFAFYLVWALVPDTLLAGMPNKYFALVAPPVVMCALTLFGFVVYPAMNLAGTFETTDVRTVRDDASIRRCRWLMPATGGAATAADRRRCDRRVAEQSGDDGGGGWPVGELCDRHADGADASTGATEGDVRIDDYCDCADDHDGGGDQCVLRRRPDHVRELLARRTVPSVCDLDVSEVSARLFGAEAAAGDTTE